MKILLTSIVTPSILRKKIMEMGKRSRRQLWQWTSRLFSNKCYKI